MLLMMQSDPVLQLLPPDYKGTYARYAHEGARRAGSGAPAGSTLYAQRASVHGAAQDATYLAIKRGVLRTKTRETLPSRASGFWSL